MISEFLNDVFKAWSNLVDFAMMAVYARAVPDWRFILRIFVLAVFLFGSAFLAATIAETRRHKMKFHFMLGLLLPYIYPLIMLFRMKTIEEVLDVEEQFDPLADLSSSMSAKFKEIQKERQSKHEQRVKRVVPEKEADDVVEEEAVENTVQAEDVEQEVSEAAGVVEEAVNVFNQRYFQNLAVDSSGAKAGPFNLLVKNGNQFRVCQIKNIQADMASFEVEVNDKIKNIRIKYDNIEIFEKI